MSTIFNFDGENAGDSPWGFEYIETETGNTFTLSSSAAYYGNYGFAATFGGVANSDRAYGYFGVVPVTEMYFRMYLYISSNMEFGAGYPCATYIFRFQQQTSPCMYLRISCQTPGSGIPTKWKWGGDVAADYSDVNFTLGAWHYIDCHWKSGTNGAFEIWVDGTSIISSTGIECNDYIDRIYIGPVGDTPVADSYIYMDEMHMATAGPLGPIVTTTGSMSYVPPHHTKQTITINDHNRHEQYDPGVTAEMAEASHAAYGPARYKRWDKCSVCDWLWPEDKLVEYEGKKYCIPLKHYKDIEYPDMLKMKR